MKKLITLFVAAITALVCLTSCGKAATKTKELNDWQKELLAAEGLPTEADELTDSQLRSIQRIYKMITYLNEKYDEEFIYGGYLEPAANQTETLYAYPRLLGADYGRNTVTVRATKDGFTDDYSDRSIVDYAEGMANDFMKDYFKSDQVIAFFSVNACDIKKNEIKDGDFQWKLGVSDIIFVDENICNADQVEEFAVNYAKWLYKHELDGRHRINVVKNYNIKDMIYGNIKEYYNSDYYIGFYSFAFDTDKANILPVSHIGYDVPDKYTVEEYFDKYSK